MLSHNPNITWEIVQANQDKPWNYGYLSYNPNITWEIVKANQDKPWNYRDLSENPNITWEIVQANQDKPWDYRILSNNPMIKGRNNFIKDNLFNLFYENYSVKNIIHEELIARVLKPDLLGKTDDDKVKRLEELGFGSDSDDDEYEEPCRKKRKIVNLKNRNDNDY